MAARHRYMVPRKELEGPPEPKSQQPHNRIKTFACEREGDLSPWDIFHDCCTACWAVAVSAEVRGLFVFHYGKPWEHNPPMVQIMAERLDKYGEAPP